MENQKNDNLNLLEAVVQNTEMGKNTLEQIVPMTEDAPFKAELLRECLKTLPQREIDLLNYAYTLELSSKEITRLTGLAPGNVRQILTRARRKVLAAYIEKGGMNHE